MSYNFDFLYIAVILLLLIGSYAVYYAKKAIVYDKVVLRMIGAAMADVLLDLITAELAARSDPALVIPSVIFNTLFFSMQVMAPALLVCYVQNLRSCDSRSIRRAIRRTMVVPWIMVGVVVVSVFTGWFFSINPDGSYCRGPYQYILYAHAVAQLIASAMVPALHLKDFKLKEAVAIWCYLLIGLFCIMMQMFFPDTLLTGFGIALSLTLLYLTVCNPMQQCDPVTSAFHVQSLRQWFQREHVSTNIVLVDLNDLSEVNKIYGSAAGDAVMASAVRLMRSELKTERVFRLGGHVFLAVVDTDEVCEKGMPGLLERFSQPIRLKDMSVVCPVQICRIGRDCRIDSVDTLISFCGYILKQHKNCHKSAMIENGPEIWKRFLREEMIGNYVVRAAQDDLFTLNYQPIWSVKEQRFTSMEVLSRLTHPTLGPIPPDQFIRIAEEKGTIDIITEQQFRRLCVFLREHPALMEQLDSVKFNLSPHELIAHRYHEKLIAMIHEYGLPCVKFQFEITETAAVEYSAPLQGVLETFHLHGIRLCMDDFGTGYANMSEIVSMPYSIVKFDRSLLLQVLTDSRAAHFYKSLVALLKSLGFTIVSEGVEKEEEVRVLEEWDVDYIQGYYFARPGDGAELLEKVGLA